MTESEREKSVSPRPTLRQLTDPVLLIASGFGSGLAPKAPGTAGSIAAFCLWPLLALNVGINGQALVVGVVVLVAWLCCVLAARRLESPDAQWIVIDEWAGLYTALLIVPAGWVWWLAALIAFRLFDILKPFPIDWLEKRVPGGTGVLLDDLVAGLLAGCSLVVLSALATAYLPSL